MWPWFSIATTAAAAVAADIVAPAYSPFSGSIALNSVYHVLRTLFSLQFEIKDE